MADIPPCRSSFTAGEEQVYFLLFAVWKREYSAAVVGRGVWWVCKQLPFSCEGAAGVYLHFLVARLAGTQLEPVGDSSSSVSKAFCR